MDNRSNLISIGMEKSKTYPFCLFRIPEIGGRVLWQITNLCNYSCEYCIFGSGPSKSKGELSTIQVIQTLDSLLKLGFNSIKFTGGEPFVRKDLFEILEHASKIGHSIDISTNASLLTTDLVKKIALLALAFVHVSIDGHNASSHEKARGANTFTPTLRGLRFLVAHGVPVRVGTVIFRDNQESIEEIVQLCLDEGAAELIFSMMTPAGRLKNNSTMNATRTIPELIVQIDSLKEKYKDKLKIHFNYATASESCLTGRCPGGSKFLFIDHLGQVSPCSWIAEHSDEFVSRKSLKESDIKSILNSEQFQNYQSYLNKNQENSLFGCPIKWK